MSQGFLVNLFFRENKTLRRGLGKTKNPIQQQQSTQLATVNFRLFVKDMLELPVNAVKLFQPPNKGGNLTYFAQ
jgi:hypothetical protein